MSRVIRGVTVAMRMIPSVVPTPAEINLPDSVMRATFAEK